MELRTSKTLNKWTDFMRNKHQNRKPRNLRLTWLQVSWDKTCFQWTHSNLEEKILRDSAWAISRHRILEWVWMRSLFNENQHWKIADSGTRRVVATVTHKEERWITWKIHLATWLTTGAKTWQFIKWKVRVRRSTWQRVRVKYRYETSMETWPPVLQMWIWQRAGS